MWALYWTIKIIILILKRLRHYVGGLTGLFDKFRLIRSQLSTFWWCWLQNLLYILVLNMFGFHAKLYSAFSKFLPKKVCVWGGEAIHPAPTPLYPGGAPDARPPKIGINMIFWRKIVIFHTKYPKYFRASLRSAQFF